MQSIQLKFTAEMIWITSHVMKSQLFKQKYVISGVRNKIKQSSHLMGSETNSKAKNEKFEVTTRMTNTNNGNISNKHK